MSTAHIEQFYAVALKDQALIAKMLQGTTGPDDFVANAVKEGKPLGYNFTAEEANAWIKQQQGSKASGELSDSQLEAVAGGKGAQNAFQNVTVYAHNQGFDDAAWKKAFSSQNPAFSSVQNFFSGW